MCTAVGIEIHIKFPYNKIGTYIQLYMFLNYSICSASVAIVWMMMRRLRWFVMVIELPDRNHPGWWAAVGGGGGEVIS